MIDEAELLQQLKSETHKQEAFKTLLSLYKERLYWHIRNIVKSHDDADDVLQNTFIKVFKNINSFKGESKLFSLMYSISTNESITFINKNSKRLKNTRRLKGHKYLWGNMKEVREISFHKGEKINIGKMTQAL